MRLWHHALIHYIPLKQLLGQHRECCALRGNGWGKKHSVVGYVFTHPAIWLYDYHADVMHEMFQRNCSPDIRWLIGSYRGKHCNPWTSMTNSGDDLAGSPYKHIYPEHNDNYLRECLMNLKSKHAELINGKTIHGMLIDLDMKLSEHA